ncbi:Putative ribonuclease H protein At1g65750 [Linum perenne]
MKPPQFTAVSIPSKPTATEHGRPPDEAIQLTSESVPIPLPFCSVSAPRKRSREMAPNPISFQSDTLRISSEPISRQSTPKMGASVARWTPGFNEEAPIQKILTWVRLPKLPIQFFNHTAVERIGNHIGRTVRLDLATAEGTRARYARVCVEVDLSRPLLGKYVIEDRTFLVEYESLDNICYSCGLYGHKEEDCKPVGMDGQVNPPSEKVATEKTGNSEGVSGSWMTVKRRDRKQSNPQSSSSPAPRLQGSRFEVLGVTEIPEQITPTVGLMPSSKVTESVPDPSQMAKELRTLLDKALRAKASNNAGTSKNKGKGNSKFPLSDITNTHGKGKAKDKGNSSKTRVADEGLVSVPILYEAPIFNSLGPKPKPKAKSKQDSETLTAKGTAASAKIKKVGPITPDPLWPQSENQSGSEDSRAYNIITQQHVRRVNGDIVKVWKWDGPNRVKYFLWLAFHEILLTNAERARRHLTTSVWCSRCRDQTETASHVLRECPIASGVWQELGFDVTNDAWRKPLPIWIAAELQKEKGLLFGITAWTIWKSRNDRVFANTTAGVTQIAFRSSNWTETTRDALNRNARVFGDRRLRQLVDVHWDPGPDDGVTLNTDGSFNPALNKASAGGIIRSSDGRGVVAFTMNLGQCSITRAEIRGALAGLDLAWEYGFRRVELQIDSQVAITLLTSQAEPEHQQAAEVLHFRNLYKRDWRVNIRHVFREANKPADFLASQGYDFPFGMHLFPLSDCNLGHLLRYDCLGISEPRLISVVN